MILDKLNLFSDNVAVTASAISDVIDLDSDVTLRNVGGPDAIYFVVMSGTVATDASSDATLEVALVSDSTANLATSPTTHLTTGTLAFATFAVANKVLMAAALPLGDYERFLGVKYTVASGPLTAGTFKAFLTRDPQFWRAMGANNPVAHN